MGIVSILADGVGLMIGSLLAAALLTFAAWWLADRMQQRPRFALLLMGVMVVGMLGSPLEASLFVRVLSVFCMVGMGILWFIGVDGAASPGSGERDGAGMAFPLARDQ